MPWNILPILADQRSWQGFVVDLFLKSSLLLCVVGVLMLALKRRSAATRHVIWLLTFAGLTLLPLATLTLPSFYIPVTTPAAATPVTSALLFSGRPDLNHTLSALPRQTTLQLQAAGADVGESAVSTATTLSVMEILSLVALAVWAIGFVLTAAPLVFGSLALVYLRRNSRSLGGSRVDMIARSLAKQLNIRRRVTVLISDHTRMPMTWGVSHPVVLLPHEATQWPLSQLRPVLVHELAHVQRFDCLTQFFVQAIRAVYWFNPLVWMAQKQLRLEQETACDDTVINAGLDAEHYATQLLTITAGLPGRYLLSAVALGMAKKRTLEKRLLAILDSNRDRRSPRRRLFGSALTALIALLSVVGPLRIALVPQSSAQASAGPVLDHSLSPIASSQELAKTLDAVRAKIQTMADRAPGEKALLEGALRGMLEAMHDPYSSYVPASDTTESLDAGLTDMVGIGIQIRKSPTGMTIVTPLPGSPARRAGLQSGDTIRSIDGKSTAEMSVTEAVKAIRGPAGSPVRLALDQPQQSREIQLERASVSIPSLHGASRNADDSWSYLIDPQEKIGYIQIGTFNSGTEKEFQDVLSQLAQQTMNGLILDLRFCPGGLLNSTIGVARMLLDKGTLVSMRSRDMQDSNISAADTALLGTKPLIVLINERTASGGEVLAGALKDNGRATLLGSRTHGKGSVQTILNLGGEQGSIKLTTAQLYLPSGRKIQRLPGSLEWGVDPNDGFYLPQSPKQVLALEERFRQHRLLGQPNADLAGAKLETADPQLGAAMRAMVARLHTGEFARVGRPIAEYAVDMQKNRVEQAKLKQRLAEIERELEVLGGKESTNS